MPKRDITHITGTFPEIVKQVRGKLLLTQEGLAEQVGVCPATVNRWEKGQGMPSFLCQQRFERLCEKYGIKIG